MDCRWVAGPVEVPSHLAHLVADFEHVQLRAVRCGERDDGSGWVPEDAQLRDLRPDALFNRLRCGDNALARLQVAAIQDKKMNVAFV